VRAAVYYSNADIRIAEMPVPAVGPGELLVRVEACGVCGSDVMEWYRARKAPLVLGHEAAGVVEQVGPGVDRFRPGDRVFANHHVPCGTCRQCQLGRDTVCRTLRSTNFDPGGFSQYVRLPELNVRRGTFRLPDAMSFDAATFIEPVACVIRAQRIAGLRSGADATVLVLGCGLAGLLHVALARHRGIARIFATDVSDWRMDRAREFGAGSVFDAREDVPLLVRTANGGAGADVVIVATAATAAMAQAMEAVEPGGTVLLYGVPAPGQTLPLDVGKFWMNAVTLTSTYANSPTDADEAIAAISAGLPVEPMITHRLPLAETARGFRLTAEAGNSLKVVIRPNA
jgi:L-iditol 2-dehydrogenase